MPKSFGDFGCRKKVEKCPFLFVTHYQIWAFSGKQAEHPPYSPDLTPNDYYSVPIVKHALSGKNFEDWVNTREDKDANLYIRYCAALASVAASC